ncbi:hypothetical protein HKX48_008875 [Thoreauomyces humboldtii]|nr:hypothetical protein HKX48_008875 [Thoreauomyces humboldtii]
MRQTSRTTKAVAGIAFFFVCGLVFLTTSSTAVDDFSPHHGIPSGGPGGRSGPPRGGGRPESAIDRVQQVVAGKDPLAQAPVQPIRGPSGSSPPGATPDATLVAVPAGIPVDALEEELGRQVLAQQYFRCLQRPSPNRQMFSYSYDIEKCFSDIAHDNMKRVMDLVLAAEPAQRMRFQGYGRDFGVPDWRIFDLFKPTYECNAFNLLRIGTPSLKGDSGKWICTDKFEPLKNCTVFSIGSRGEFDFERDIKTLFPNCTVHTFDCTAPRGVVWADNSTTVHPWCVGGKDLVQPAQGYQLSREYKRLSTISRDLNVDTISLLKMDIENFEWPFFIDLLNEPVENRPMQILVEFHGGMPDPRVPQPWTLAPTMFEDWEGNWAVPIARMVKLFDQLGYRIAFQERNAHGWFASEIVLLHERAL